MSPKSTCYIMKKQKFQNADLKWVNFCLKISMVITGKNASSPPLTLTKDKYYKLHPISFKLHTMLNQHLLVQTSEYIEAVHLHDDIAIHFVMNTEKLPSVTSPHIWFTLQFSVKWQHTTGININ